MFYITTRKENVLIKSERLIDIIIDIILICLALLEKVNITRINTILTIKNTKMQTTDI